MILILGGTTEGRSSVKVADEAGVPYYYSTKGSRQEVECAHGIRLTGALDAESMEAFCREKGIRLVIDAAHPFALALHRTLAAVADSLQLPVIRYERRYPPREEDLIWCEDYADAVRRMRAEGIHRLLALTGINTVAPLRAFWETEICWFRILNREESVEIARKQGFSPDHLVFYKEGEEDDLIDRLRPDALLTKESGYSGYFREKTEAGRRHRLPVFVIKRPALPLTFYRVYGEDGLRKHIERLAPDFFPLHSGYTTGACATAAAKAALLALLTGKRQTESRITLPSGESIALPVAFTEWNEETEPLLGKSRQLAEEARENPPARLFETAVPRHLQTAVCTVIKEAGDDPDVTNGCAIRARIQLEETPVRSSAPMIRFQGGEGVGKVTLPGLGLAIGEPAINATPRKMITQELTEVLQDPEVLKKNKIGLFLERLQVTVTLSVPGGAELAARTFNPKLGIVGGISIIGTSGIVRPFSSDAFVASIRKEAQVARATGCQTLVLNSGAKSERFIKAFMADDASASLPSQAYIHYGNFIGETLKIASEFDFPHIILGIMIGKAVKLAEGALDTHSKKVVMNKSFLKALAQEAGCSPASAEAIGSITLARELWTLFPAEEQSPFFKLLLQKCRAHCRPLLPRSSFSLFLITEEGSVPYQIPEKSAG